MTVELRFEVSGACTSSALAVRRRPLAVSSVLHGGLPVAPVRSAGILIGTYSTSAPVPACNALPPGRNVRPGRPDSSRAVHTRIPDAAHPVATSLAANPGK